jgi:3-isopropylmalate dehydrogenase
MAKYKIGWMPGDGVGVDVMDATRTVLDKLGFDAEYVNGDISWELWKT